MIHRVKSAYLAVGLCIGTIIQRVLTSQTKKYIQSMRSDGLIGSIEYAGTVIPLIKYNVTPQKATYGKTPVKAAVKQSESQVELAKSFTAQMPNGHIGIYERKSDSSYPIKQLYGPSVPRMAENAVVLKTVEDRVNEVINNRMEHELDRILNGGS